MLWRELIAYVESNESFRSEQLRLFLCYFRLLCWKPLYLLKSIARVAMSWCSAALARHHTAVVLSIDLDVGCFIFIVRMQCYKFWNLLCERCPFRQYISTKPAKYGIKTWCLCDAATFYPHNGQMCCGRLPHEQCETGQSKRAVLDFSQPLFNTDRNICAGNFFTSMELKQHRLSYLRAVKRSKLMVPTEFMAIRRRQLH